MYIYKRWFASVPDDENVEFASPDVSTDEDDLTNGDSGNIFSDPESEWNADDSGLASNTLNSQVIMPLCTPPDSLPESDQNETKPLQRRPSFVIMEDEWVCFAFV